ncbi:MAG: hypothetical protein ACKVYV_10005 [Limisphaerales bacterium]
MTTNEATHILTLLEIGSRIDTAHLRELQEALSVSLHSGRHFGTLQGLPDTSDMNWQRNWDNVEKILNRTGELVNEMAGGLDSHESDHLKRATAAWEAIQCEGDLLQEALEAIRTQANGLSATGRKQWNLLARTLESELEAIHFCAEALRIKLELQNGRSKEEAERMVRSIVSKLPKRNRKDGVADELYDHEFRKAVIGLQREQHEFLGGMDVLKGLLMWAETPDSRMRRNRSLSVSN